MRPRDLLILCLLLAFGGSIGLVFLGDDSHATELMPEPVEAAELPVTTAPDTATPAPAVTDQNGGEPAGGGFRKSDGVSTTGWTSGVVRGDIQLAVSVLDRIESISVIVEELRGAVVPGVRYQPPFKKVVTVERGIGTPTFEVRDIPFSAHPYSVSVYSPALNGGRRTVTLDEQSPLHDDIVLTITPGAPYSILVRDQDQNPYPNIDIRIVPIGSPPGRKQHIGKTDNYGSVVFESVLAGEYDLVSTQQGLPLCPPERVTIQPGARRYGNKIQGQGYTLDIQRGMALEIMVSRVGYGIADAAVKLQALDRTQLLVLEAATDFAGRVTFPHLTPGRWMVTVIKADHDPWTRPITIKDGELPPRLEVGLKRLR